MWVWVESYIETLDANDALPVYDVGLLLGAVVRPPVIIALRPARVVEGDVVTVVVNCVPLQENLGTAIRGFNFEDLIVLSVATHPS